MVFGPGVKTGTHTEPVTPQASAAIFAKFLGIRPPAHADFPDGYVTLEHAPYKLRVTLTTAFNPLKKRPAQAWTYFHILIKGYELALGEEHMVPAAVVDDDRHKLDKAVRAKIEADGGLPATGATRKVFLVSNLYKTSNAEMDDNSAFTQYQVLWGDGPNIPIVAKIRLADSTSTGE